MDWLQAHRTAESAGFPAVAEEFQPGVRQAKHKMTPKRAVGGFAGAGSWREIVCGGISR